MEPHEFLNANIALRDLVFKALEYAIEARSRGQKLKPFSLTSKEIREFNTFQDLETSKEQLSHTEELMIAYVFDGTLGAPPEVDWSTKNALYVQGFDKIQEKAVLLVQMYQPVSKSAAFSLLGPAIVQHIPNAFKSERWE